MVPQPTPRTQVIAARLCGGPADLLGGEQRARAAAGSDKRVRAGNTTTTASGVLAITDKEEIILFVTGSGLSTNWWCPPPIVFLTFKVFFLKLTKSKKLCKTFDDEN